MKTNKIKIFCSVFCVFAFTQCNKEMGISEFIAQTEKSYDNLDKVVTFWKEGCTKIETDWEEGCGKELNDWFAYLDETTPKMKRLNIIWLFEVGVISLSPNCGDYPRLTIMMDCEDSNNISKIRNWRWDKTPEEAEVGSVSWLTTYGIQCSSSGDITFNFCLVPHQGQFPCFANPYHTGDHPWGVYTLTDLGPYGNNGISYKYVNRFIDNEDKNNINKSYLFWYCYITNSWQTFNFYPTPTPYSVYPYTPPYYYFHGKDTYFPFLQKYENSNYYSSNYNKYSFPNFGFSYAVLSRRPWGDTGLVAEVLSDDEDSNNINSWYCAVDGLYGDRVDKTYQFIRGKTDTQFFVTQVKWQ